MKERKWVEREKCDGAIYDILCHEFRSVLGPPARHPMKSLRNFDVALPYSEAGFKNC